ncbi:MAG: Rrf2 family transcriptional regulator [Eubacteriales bacterium]|nr:Rrf2 family transcriptional regulator [Eubacteriales bacterium]
MKISTKGQYALQMMLDLAINDTGEYITIKSIAKRQNLSEKYLEQIINILSKAQYVSSVRGAKGGYRLTKRPEEYTVGMILRTIEGSLAPIACIEENSADCRQVEGCLLCDLWKQINDAVNSVVDNITLDDLVKKYQSNVGYEYII